MNADCLWVYRARVKRVVDGDTLIAELDTGFHSYRWERLRLLGVDCPEMVGERRAAGIAAKMFVENWVRAFPATPWGFLIKTFETDSFGRYLGYVIRVDDGESLTAALIMAGHGVPA